MLTRYADGLFFNLTQIFEHALNPTGWNGDNWKEKGFDIYAYFPTFNVKLPPSVNLDDPNPNPEFAGHGDLRVDYQFTTQDWARITAELNPCAIITFSRGLNDTSWEIEYQLRNWEVWGKDFIEPREPDNTPPDDDIAPLEARITSLPSDEIVSRINRADDLNIYGYVDDNLDSDAGRFLSEYIGLLGVKYQANNSHCISAGHIHVGQKIPLDQAVKATEITLGALIDHISNLLFPSPPGGIGLDEYEDPYWKLMDEWFDEFDIDEDRHPEYWDREPDPST
ncbi:MAG: hypothetical protein H6565_11010 [Lewinellaceae bacterium]|nr:hypothetical protein [Lewinellaceae bacterium]